MGKFRIIPSIYLYNGNVVDKETKEIVGDGDAVELATFYNNRGADEDVYKRQVCFLADMGDFGAFNEVYGKYFTEKPARSCVAVKELPKNVLCEVEVIAEI